MVQVLPCAALCADASCSIVSDELMRWMEGKFCLTAQQFVECVLKQLKDIGK